MTLLPIVQRELRLAARKRSTFWFRLLVALTALVIGAGFLVMNLAAGAAPARLGSGLFSTLTWLTLAATIVAGVFFTADSLSEEKREGTTLGFLFLTDLRGYDVVGGKLLATSLRGAYALLALFPVLALTLLMGGISGLQFWRNALALSNSLFCSLTAGLFVSALCRNSQRAMAGTLILLLLVCAGGPIVDSILRISVGSGFRPLLSLVSPVHAFAASASGRAPFWSGLVASHLMGWSWFGLACVLVRRTWQDRRVKGSDSMMTRVREYSRPLASSASRRKLMDWDPVAWLASRERGRSVAVWVLVSLVLAPFVAVLITVPSAAWLVWAQVSGLLLLALYLLTASHAARFFVEARRSGLTELLLVTPLDSRKIVLGQWLATLQTFGLPVVLLLLVQLAGGVFSQHTSMRMMSGALGGYSPPLALNIFLCVLTVLSVVGNLIAIVWVGMWMGLMSRNTGIATLKTLIFVQVLPWLAITFISTSFVGVLMFRGISNNGPPSNSTVLSFPLLISGLSAMLTIAKDAAFFVWARQKLYSSFRAVAAAPFSKVVGVGPLPQRSSTIPLPPVIADRR
jgi:hypothetical protein